MLVYVGRIHIPRRDLASAISANGRLPSMRILLLNLSADPLLEANNVCRARATKSPSENGLNVDQVLALAPEVLVTEAAPSDLACCGLITQLKSRTDNRTLKIIMIVPGGALERARALDLGADDVISLPFDGVEFAARVRTQFRERQPEEELKTMLKYAIQREKSRTWRSSPSTKPPSSRNAVAGCFRRSSRSASPRRDRDRSPCWFPIIAAARTRCSSKRKSRG